MCDRNFRPSWPVSCKTLQMLKLRPEGPAPPRQKGFQGFNGEPHDLRRFDIAAFLKMTKQNRRLLPLRQGLQGAGDLAAHLAVVQTNAGQRRLVGYLGRFLQGLGGTPPEPVVALVEHHPVKPGLEFGAAWPPATGMGPEPEENLLHGVFGFGPAGQHAPSYGEKLGAVAGNQPRRRVTVAPPSF